MGTYPLPNGKIPIYLFNHGLRPWTFFVRFSNFRKIDIIDSKSPDGFFFDTIDPKDMTTLRPPDSSFTQINAMCPFDKSGSYLVLGKPVDGLGAGKTSRVELWTFNEDLSIAPIV